MEFELELDKAIDSIKKNKAIKVCIQLPDGLKPKAQEITDKIREETNSEVLIWAGSTFGACDIPLEIERLDVDLLIHWGHAAWSE